MNPDGTRSYTPDQPLANGAHDLTTTVTDPSGNTGPEGSHVVITVDVVPGKVEITGVTDDAGSVTGSLSQNAVTDDTRPQISGTAKAGSTVTIMDGSNVLGTTTAGADGTGASRRAWIWAAASTPSPPRRRIRWVMSQPAAAGP